MNELFDPESALHQYNYESLDATEFFTAYVKAGAYLFNKLTGIEKNALEYTHLANQLIVQDMLAGKDDGPDLD